ncbi:hypothetical protein ILYODFUR_024242 [Ilyodon furcidens]|uniref:Secreted protein n=1 Tax=Ilyodon furcidens TaxID=33524 RepID=A0ABV0TN76_9TELE
MGGAHDIIHTVCLTSLLCLLHAVCLAVVPIAPCIPVLCKAEKAFSTPAIACLQTLTPPLHSPFLVLLIQRRDHLE